MCVIDSKRHDDDVDAPRSAYDSVYCVYTNKSLTTKKLLKYNVKVWVNSFNSNLR